MRLVDISLLIISALLGLFLAIYIFQKRRGPGSQALSVLVLGASLWSFGYAFEIIAYSLPGKLFWEKFEFFGIIIIPLAWFTFVTQYLGYPGWMKRIIQHKVLLGIIPTVTLILVWTNDLHHLVWTQAELEAIGPLIALDLIRGSWFWVLIFFSYALLLLGSIKLAISLFGIVRLQRWQVSLTLLAILLPWIGNILYITGLSPEHFLDWTAFLFLISGVLFSVSLFRFQLVNILPIAQGAVFAGLADCVLVLDMNNCIVDMNPSARKVVNSSGVDMLGKSLSLVMPELVDHIGQAGDECDYKTEIIQGEGQNQEYYDLHISLLTDAYANPIGRVIVLHQITQLKKYQAELEGARDQLETIVSERTEALRQAVEQLKQELTQRTLAEKRFEDVIESAPDAMFVVDQSGKILLINAMAEVLFGYPREEMVGMNIAANLIPPRYLEKQRKYFVDFLQNPSDNQSSFGVDLYGRRKDGSEFSMEVDLSRLDATNGFWVAINVRDISERKQVENALRESEETYRALFENAGDAIFMTNLEGKILEANHKAAQLFGFSQTELRSLSILDLTVPEEYSDVRWNMEKLIMGTRLFPYIRHYLKRSGEILPTENNTVLVTDADGNPRFFQNISRDITERLKAEQAQNQLMAEIRRSNEQMRDLALRLQEVQELERQELATILHDRVGQNLTGLNLNLKILQNQLQVDFNGEIQKRLAQSSKMVEETTHMIRDVMADLNPPVLDEYGLMAAIKWYSGDFSSRTGISTHVNGGKFDPGLAPGVERILFRLVQESLNNIAKHAQASRVEISLRSAKEIVSVTIKDNGIGFDPLEIKKSTSEPHWGLLSMQQRAASIGATLAIDSTPGLGTQVSVKIRRNHHDD